MCSESLVRDGKARRVDRRGVAVAEIDHVRGVAEALVDELVDPHHHTLLKEYLEYCVPPG